MIYIILAVLAIITLITTFRKLAKHIHLKVLTYKDFFHIGLSGVPAILILLFQFGNDLFDISLKQMFSLLGFLCALLVVCISSGYFLTMITSGTEYKLTKKVFIITGAFSFLAVIFTLIGFN